MIALLMTVVGIYGLVTVANEPAAGMAGFVVTVIFMGFGFALFVGDSLERHIPTSLWDRFSLSPVAYRRLGVKLFNTLLSRIGWNRVIFSFRGDQSWNPRHMRAAATGHGWAFLLHIATAVWASVSGGGWMAPGALLVVGIVGHLYPVFLQIYVLTLLREGKIPRR